MTLADRIGVMDRGRLMQVRAAGGQSTSSRIRAGLADFIGDVNLFEGRLGGGRVRASRASAGGACAPPAGRRRTRSAGLEPRCGRRRSPWRASRRHASGAIARRGGVVDIGYLGDMSLYKVRLAGGSQMKAAIANIGRRPDGEAPAFDEEVWLGCWRATLCDALSERACGVCSRSTGREKMEAATGASRRGGRSPCASPRLGSRRSFSCRS